MFRELEIKNFRAFVELRLTGLGRVNLLVGANNSGKTSVLEAVALLASGGDPEILHASLLGRGERPSLETADYAETVDVRYAFFGRSIGEATAASVEGTRPDASVVRVKLSTPRVPAKKLPEWREAVGKSPRHNAKRGNLRQPEFERTEGAARYLRIASSSSRRVDVPLLPNGGLTSSNAAPDEFERDARIRFLRTSGIERDELARLYDNIALTPEEASVLAALREIEPGIERLATRSTDARYERGFIVAIKGAAEPIALGSLGDGIHRLLAIALSLVAARGGYLLVDEIDTGLHHTVMRKMWRLVFETAKRLDITVFATTHSYDCVVALAEIATPGARADGDVALLRIERDNPEAIHFSEDEIAHLAEWRIEAR